MNIRNRAVLFFICISSSFLQSMMTGNHNANFDETRTLLDKIYLSWQKPNHPFSQTMLIRYKNPLNFSCPSSKINLLSLSPEYGNEIKKGNWIYNPSFLEKNGKNLGALIIATYITEDRAEWIVKHLQEYHHCNKALKKNSRELKEAPLLSE